MSICVVARACATCTCYVRARIGNREKKSDLFKGARGRRGEGAKEAKEAMMSEGMRCQGQAQASVSPAHKNSPAQVPVGFVAP